MACDGYASSVLYKFISYCAEILKNLCVFSVAKQKYSSSKERHMELECAVSQQSNLLILLVVWLLFN